MSLYIWQPLAADRSLLALKYRFSFGTTNTLAVKLDDGSWIVVSPAMDAAPHVLDELARQGPVRALLAPNAFHHMGQAAFRARFPDAKSYAPAGSLARLAKQARGIPFEPLEALQAQLPSRIALLLPDGMKQPDLFVRATSGSETVWYTGDLISNTSEADISFVTRLIFGLMGGGTGYRFNPVPSMVYLRDRDAWRSSVRKATADIPPTVVLPAHGDLLREEVASRTQSVLA